MKSPPARCAGGPGVFPRSITVQLHVHVAGLRGAGRRHAIELDVADVEVVLRAASQVAGTCTLTLGTQYYLNVRNVNFDRVTPACTPQTCYMNVQLNSY